jgi:hypothetical protein
MIVIIMILILVLSSPISAGLAYWKRNALFGTNIGEECDIKTDKIGCKLPLKCEQSICRAPENTACKVNENCQSPLVCDTDSMKCQPAAVVGGGGGGGSGGGSGVVLGDSCSTEKKCESPLVCSDLVCKNTPECGIVVMRSHPERQNIPFPWCMSTREWYPTLEEADLACGCIVADTV